MREASADQAFSKGVSIQTLPGRDHALRIAVSSHRETEPVSPTTNTPPSLPFKFIDRMGSPFITGESPGIRREGLVASLNGVRLQENGGSRICRIVVMRPRSLVVLVMLILVLLATLVRTRWHTQPRSAPASAPPDLFNSSATPGPESDGEAPPDSPSADATKGPSDKLYSIRGRVVWLDGTPAHGCRVRLEQMYVEVEGDSDQSVSTDAEGMFCFEGLLAGESGQWYLEVSSEPGFKVAWATVDVRDDAKANSVLLTIPDTRNITVTVVDERGVGLAGVRVFFETEHRVPPRFKALRPSDPRPEEIGTDEHGLARATVIPYRAEVRVWIKERRYRGDDPLPRLYPGPLLLPRGHDSARFVVKDTGLATGMVISVQGQPIDDQPVLVFLGDIEIAQTTTNSEGAFVVPVPFGESVSLRLGHAGSRMRGTGTLDARLGGVRAGDQNLRLQLEVLPNNRSLTVRVEGPEGQPVAGAMVDLMRDNARVETLQTDSAGIASSSTLPDLDVVAETYLELGDSRANGDWLPPAPVPLVPDGQELRLRFRAGCVLSGVVLGPAGEPRPDACVMSSIPRARLVHADERGRFSLLVDPDDPAQRTLEAWAGATETRLFAKTGVLDPHGGEVVIRLEREP